MKYSKQSGYFYHCFMKNDFMTSNLNALNRQNVKNCPYFFSQRNWNTSLIALLYSIKGGIRAKGDKGNWKNVLRVPGT